MKKIAFVLPVYNEEETLCCFYETLHKFVSKITKYDFCFIFVDDNSHDRSINILKNLKSINNKISLIALQKNHGQSNALFIGLLNAQKYDAVITMDTDMQDPVEIIPRLINKWEKGYFIVNTFYKNNETLFYTRALIRDIFYFVFSKILKSVYAYSSDYRLLDKMAVGKLVKYKCHPIFIRNIIYRLDFEKAFIEYEKNVRYSGNSKYNILKTIKFGGTALLACSGISFILGWFFHNKNHSYKIL